MDLKNKLRIPFINNCTIIDRDMVDAEDAGQIYQPGGFPVTTHCPPHTLGFDFTPSTALLASTKSFADSGPEFRAGFFFKL